MKRFDICGLLAACLVLAASGAAAQGFTPMANQPDPRDFVSRAETQLTLSGTPFRFGGLNIPWLGQRQDGMAPPRRPSKFEVEDALETAQAMGATVIRAPGLIDNAGCALCLETQPGQLSADAFAQLDLVLMAARDLGLKVILPLADSAMAAAPGFLTDSGRRAAFTGRVGQILAHRNSLTGMPYAADPTILAWENCEGCGSGAPDAAVSDWGEQIGRVIKGADKHHLYESGAFAGRIGRSASARVAAALYATPSVDIIGDRLPALTDEASQRGLLSDTLDEIGRSGRAYVLDSFAWGPAVWRSDADLEGWLQVIERARSLAGALTGNLQAHAATGGYLPAPPASVPGMDGLYFPGRATASMELPAMQARGRALRRFNYAMTDVIEPPTYQLPPKPDVISAIHGKVVWRGAAGAATYSIERSADPGTPFSWETVCDACATDDPGFWQDPSPANGSAWYRVMPFNINGHKAEPSEAFQGR